MSEDVIRTEEVSKCPLCGNGQRKILYTGLRDRLFGAPGEWTIKECYRCGLVFLDPRPISEDVGKAYSVYHTHSRSDLVKKDSLVRRIYQPVKDGYFGRRWGYKNGLKKWQMALALSIYLLPGRRAGLDSSIMHLEATPGGRLVDVGCGSGALIERLRNLGWQAQGVEVDSIAVQIARNCGLEVYLGTLEAQNYPDASFDAVTMSHVIEHVHDPLQLLHECYRILRPGGRLVITTPNISSLGHKYFKAAWRSLEPPRHLQIFTPPLLFSLGEKIGFRSSQVLTTIVNADGIFLASHFIGRTGDYAMGIQPRITRALAWGAQLVEWLALKARPDTGEEITVILYR